MIRQLSNLLPTSKVHHWIQKPPETRRFYFLKFKVFLAASITFLISVTLQNLFGDLIESHGVFIWIDFFSIFVVLTIACVTYLFSQYSRVRMYRLRWLFIQLFNELKFFEHCTLEYWEDEGGIHINIYTSGSMGSEMKKQIPERLQDFLVKNSNTSDHELWHLKNESFESGYIKLIFGSIESREVFGKENL